MMYEEQEDKRFSPKKSASWELIDLDNTDKVEYLIPIQQNLVSASESKTKESANKELV